MKKGRKKEIKLSKILPNDQIVTACCIELRVNEMTMNEKLTMIGPTIINVKYFIVSKQKLMTSKRHNFMLIFHKYKFPSSVYFFIFIYIHYIQGSLS